MSINSHMTKDVKVLEITGSFDIYTAAPVRDWMDAETSQMPANIVVDMTHVHFIDSTALAILVRGMKRCRERNGDIHLCGLQQPVRMVLELTRLDRVFEIYLSQNEAVIGFEN